MNKKSVFSFGFVLTLMKYVIRWNIYNIVVQHLCLVCVLINRLRILTGKSHSNTTTATATATVTTTNNSNNNNSSTSSKIFI